MDCEGIYGGPLEDRRSDATGRPAVTTVTVRLGWGVGKFTAWVAASRAKPGEAVVVGRDERRSFSLPNPSPFFRSTPTPSPAAPARHSHARRARRAARGSDHRAVRRRWEGGCGSWPPAASSSRSQGASHPSRSSPHSRFSRRSASASCSCTRSNQLIARALKHPRRIGWRVHACAARGLEGGGSWLTAHLLKEPTADAEPHRRAAQDATRAIAAHRRGRAVSFSSSPRSLPARRSCNSSRATRRRPRARDSSVHCRAPRAKSACASSAPVSITSSRSSHGRAFPSAATH
jgi:hypothetical protein